LDGDNFRHRVFSQLLEKADVPKMRFHDIRHTFASLLLQQGAPIHYVKDQMGHASITTTVDTYGHVMPNANRNAVNKLDDLAGGSVPPALAIAG
jgi:integrase